MFDQDLKVLLWFAVLNLAYSVLSETSQPPANRFLAKRFPVHCEVSGVVAVSPDYLSHVTVSGRGVKLVGVKEFGTKDRWRAKLILSFPLASSAQCSGVVPSQGSSAASASTGIQDFAIRCANPIH
ncbi:hypothetical protein [Lentzea albidocapillata]|uniref:hypothetical protein n=1 Tax=Lentzea albidocapillata TaxID=40571 RepID=UPI00115FDA43|nr:hypothetical protein [Lentzea albidocapillata]